MAKEMIEPHGNIFKVIKGWEFYIAGFKPGGKYNLDI